MTDLRMVCATVGQLAAHCAFVRGAERVIIIDDIEYRLQFAKDRMPKIETINFDKVKVCTADSTLLQSQLVPQNFRQRLLEHGMKGQIHGLHVLVMTKF